MRRANLDHESAKERALRIPLDYVDRVDRVQRRKLTTCLIALLVTGGYGAWVTLGDYGSMAFSHGPVAHVHAAWDANCSACHVEYVAIRENAANPLARLGIFPWQEGSLTESQIHQRVDHKCQACHVGAVHHDNEVATDARTCVSCHSDHRGRNVDIARPADIHCTRCHADIMAHRRDGMSQATPAIENVSQFSTDSPSGRQNSHPEFRSLATDPGNVKFNHAMHMTAGIPARDPNGQGKKLLKLSDLPAEFVEQYRRSDQKRDMKQDSEYFVQLDCSTCHRLDVTDDRLALTGRNRVPSPGAYMLPVNFDNNCRACHHLYYEPGDKKEIKHGLRPEEAREFLFGRYGFDSKSGQLAENATRLVPRRTIPGRSPPDSSAPDMPGDIDKKVAGAERYLRKTNACAKCHLLKTPDTTTTDWALPDVQPANIPQVWFQHARFDHSAHAALNCAECHANAYPLPSLPSQFAEPADHDVVMIGGRDICLKCHSPRSESGSTGSARYDCVECHQYHGADLLLHKSGTVGVPLPQRLTIDQFLQGTPHTFQVQKQD